MGHAYRAVNWNRQKRIYDGTLAAGVLAYLALFVGVGLALHPEATAETLLIRGLGTGAFLLLHLILSIGPLARIDRRFLPLLYNRRHLGVTMFGLALAHGVFSLVQFHALGDVSPFVSLLSANPRFDSWAWFPFQPLGALALGILFLMAATSHDFWLTNLSAPTWKALHMGVYVAYALIVLHVALGVLQAETSPWLAAVVGAGVAWILVLHGIAGRREKGLDEPADAGGTDFVDVCGVDEIPEKRARIVTLGGDRVAVFRHDGKVSALSNACQHQNGPLGEGRIIDGCVTCPWHGYQYSPENGRSPAPFTERVPTFRVRVDRGRVFVDPTPLPAGTETTPAQVPPGDEPSGGDFYVGYLPQSPPRLARSTRSLALAAIAVAAAVALVLVAAQHPFSKARFEFGTTRSFEGRIETLPYPTLLVDRPDGGHSRFLLSSFGKFGADARVAGLDGKRVRLDGSLIYRDDQTMLELSGAPPTEIDAGSGPGPAPRTEDLGVHTYVGEIVDSKCFLGVMKPGNTKPHRACAARCISGGVPPVLLVRAADGSASYLLLASKDGDSVNAAVLDLVAEPVEITGQVLRYDDLLVLRADPNSYRRIE